MLLTLAISLHLMLCSVFIIAQADINIASSGFTVIGDKATISTHARMSIHSLLYSFYFDVILTFWSNSKPLRYTKDNIRNYALYFDGLSNR